MNDKIQRLRALKEQMQRKAHLESLRNELTKQQRELSEKTEFLKKAAFYEQKDVERLEKGGLVSLFYELTGKKGQKLEKEQQEAYAARLKYEAAVREQQDVEHRLRRVKEESNAIGACEREYDELLNELLADIKASGDHRSEEVLRMEQEIGENNALIREITEAITAGKAAASAADEVLNHLSDAEGWGTWDLFGGGLIADIAKHSALDSAQTAVAVLQSRLRSFKTELVDVDVEADVQISLDGFMSFADFFFDGIFMDYAVMNHIEQASDRVRKTKSRIREILNALSTLQTEREAAIHTLREQLARLVME
ncbi:MAG: hypothetical protein IJA67_15390 [Oscillospiraceae bacterium]|nr:hypothetical protein [Oscillospiraceae bacterium]